MKTKINQAAPTGTREPWESEADRRGVRYWMELLFKSPVGTVGFIIIVLVILSSLLAGVISPYDPAKIVYADKLIPPAWCEGGSMAHLLGTDSLGRDLLTRILVGARVSLLVGIFSVVVAGVIGTSLGLVAGYYGSWIDSVIMRVADAFHAIPRILLAMVVLFVLGPSVLTLIMVIGVTNWVSYARLIRGEVLTLKEKEFVKASRTIGAGDGAILMRHILPNVFAQLLLCKQAAKNFHTICKKETALKRVLSNLLSAVSLLRFKAVFSCGFRVPPGSGLYQSCAAGSVCIPAGQKYCSPRPRKSCPADRKTPGLPSRCIGHRW